VELTVRIADDRFTVGIHAAAGAPLFRLHSRLSVADAITQTEKREKHEKQKRDSYQKSVSTGEESLSRQKRPHDGVTGCKVAPGAPTVGLGWFFYRLLIYGELLRHRKRQGSAGGIETVQI